MVAPLRQTAAAQPAETAAEPASYGSSVVETLAQGNSALRFPAALRHFFAALQQREQEPGNGTVRVMQWGDSHTAADMFTGELRARMQARFGDGGVGFTYAGHPFAGYRILGSGRGESGAWATLGTHFTQLGDGLLGMGGVAIESYRAGDTATLDAPCLTLDLQYLRQPGGGTLQIADNGFAVQTISTASGSAPAQPLQLPRLPRPGDPDYQIPATRAQPMHMPPTSLYGAENTAADEAAAQAQKTQTDKTETEVDPDTPEQQSDTGAVGNASGGSGGTFHYSCPPGSHHFTFSSEGGGPVRLLGTTSLQPGVTWEAMGINGAEAPLILRWNQPLFRGYLAAASPDLIVLAYGTNEAAARWTGADYRTTFTRLIDTLHTTSPNASILVLGPGDRSLGATTYTVTGRGRRKRRIAHRYYTPYTGTDRILNAQRDVCSTTGKCAFWDWRARQGGLGAMNRWVSAGYAQPDHTHLTGTGYRALADALTADLLSAYSTYQQGTSLN